VNIGVFLGTALRGAGVDSLESLRALGAVAAWRQLREAQPEVASMRTLLALAGAIRGIRWGTLPRLEQRELIGAVASEQNEEPGGPVPGAAPLADTG
jgi:DNA transformation protein